MINHGKHRFTFRRSLRIPRRWMENNRGRGGKGQQLALFLNPFPILPDIGCLSPQR